MQWCPVVREQCLVPDPASRTALLQGIRGDRVGGSATSIFTGKNQAHALKSSLEASRNQSTRLTHTSPLGVRSWHSSRSYLTTSLVQGR